MTRKTGILLSSILVLILIAAGISCSKTTTTPAQTTAPAPTTTKSPAPTTTTPPATGGPQYGGTLKIITSPGVSNLGYPGKIYLPGETTLPQPAVESLNNFDPKGSGAVVPRLDSSWQWAPDYKSVTITLRQGVNFQDGTVCDAAAVKWNIDLYRTGWRPEIKGVASVDVIDPYTVRLNVPGGYDNKIPQGLCSLCGLIFSPTAVQKMGDGALLHPVGTGAFVFDSYNTDVSLTFKKWDGYREKGLPYLDAIQWVFIKDPMTQLMSFKAGEGNVLLSVPPNSVAELQSSGQYNMLGYPTAAMGLAGDSNHADSPFHDIRVRQAIAYAIDNAAVAKACGFGFYKPINQFFDPTGPYYSKDVVGYPYNPQKAKDLLTAAGFPSGFNTKITFQATDSDQVSMMSAIQGFLADVGIKADLDAADPARLQAIDTQGWHNQMIYHWSPIARSVPPGTSMSHLYGKGTSWDWTSLWIPADVTAAYEKASAEPDYAKSVVLWQQFSKMIVDQYCLSIPVMAPFRYLASYKNVHDLDLRVYAMGEWLPSLAWMSK